jgi:maltooligosyltrehalose trehalohydrolase
MQPAAEPAPNAPEDVRSGARPLAGTDLTGDGVRFRVWAPGRHKLAVLIEGPGPSARLAMRQASDGLWIADGPGLRAGTRYRFLVDGHDQPLPDPYSRFQPEGPDGPSEVIDPAAFPWDDADWKGVRLPGQIIYEMHIGSFSPEGTWEGAARRLQQLRELGVTVLQVMPVSEFAGEFGWGYDGVDLFAPYHRYGRPDDFRRFVAQAHRLGLAVILDVVYNHFGPAGNYLDRFSRHYFADKHTEWGQAINYDGLHAEGARSLAVDNAAYWIREFHLDGLRLDATQAIYDESKDHLVTALTRAARAAARTTGTNVDRSIVIVGENEPQDCRMITPPAQGGHGLDALYNEDLHHTAVVAATGCIDGYYSEYTGTPQELLSAVKHGFLFQGQRYHWQKQRRGRPARGIAPAQIVGFLENHDQVANSTTGERLWQLTSPGRHRALTTLLFCGPWTPFLFQGAEWNSSRPFFYFADHHPELAALVRKGRGEFLSQFTSCQSPEAQAALADPGDRATFETSRLDWDERDRPEHARALALHRDLIALRKRDPVLAAQGRPPVTLDGAVLGPECFLVRYFEDSADDRLLIVNLGRELRLRPAPEPLLAAPEGGRWRLIFSSDDRRYGGPGACAPESEDEGWTIAGQAACLLGVVPIEDHGNH